MIQRVLDVERERERKKKKEMSSFQNKWAYGRNTSITERYQRERELITCTRTANSS